MDRERRVANSHVFLAIDLLYPWTRARGFQIRFCRELPPFHSDENFLPFWFAKQMQPAPSTEAKAWPWSRCVVYRFYCSVFDAHASHNIFFGTSLYKP